MRRYFIVWNETKTEGFVTTDEQLAYETRKSADTNLYKEDGSSCAVAKAFCDVWGDGNCTSEVHVI